MSGRTNAKRFSKRPTSAFVSDVDILSFVLKDVILSYDTRNKTRNDPKDMTGNACDARTQACDSVRVSTASITVDIMDNSVSGDAKGQKFPRELVRFLKEGLKRVVMHQDVNFDDLLLRGTFGVFYGIYIQDTFYKQMKESRKLEDLLLIFVSQSASYLQKRVPVDQVKALVNQHVAKFVQLILQVLRINNLTSSNTQLASRLRSYEEKLLSHGVLDPGRRSISANPVRPTLNQLSRNSELEAIAARFSVSEILLEKEMEILQPDCTTEAAIRDLKIMLNMINMQNSKVYRPCDFVNENAYRVWKAAETYYLTQQIVDLASKTAILNSMYNKNEPHQATRDHESARISSDLTNSDISKSLSDDGHSRDEKVTIEDSTLYLVPPAPHTYYNQLVSICMAYDLENVLPHPHSEPQILSAASKKLLLDCRLRWRIADSTHEVACMACIKTIFLEGRLSLELLDLAFQAAFDYGVPDYSLWTKNDRQTWVKILTGLNDFLFRDLYAELQTVYSTFSVDLSAAVIIEQYIFKDNLFQENPPDIAYLLRQLEEGVECSAAESYKVTCGQLAAKQDLNIAEVVGFVNDITRGGESLRKRFKKKLFDQISLPGLYLKTLIPSLLIDIPKLVRICTDLSRENQLEIASEDMLYLVRSIQKLSECYISHFHVAPDLTPVNAICRIYVLRWLEDASKTIQNLVTVAITSDSFTKEEDRAIDGQSSSRSIVDLFHCFNQHLKFLKDLQWSDLYENAKFYTQLSQVFCKALHKYGQIVEEMFTLEMNAVRDETLIRDRQKDGWINKARDAMGKTEQTEPFHIAQQACVKLNNIEYARQQLDKLERNVDTEKVSHTIEEVEGPLQRWEPGQRATFTIKIVAAENLKPCDTNGHSNPYVVLTNELGKRIGKTRTIDTNLNPRWEECFDVVIEKSFWIVATIWDRDRSGDHDVCGRCHLSLDPRHFENPLPRDFIVDLDTEGHLLLRITMEPEIDDSGYYFGRAFRKLKRVENDMTRAIVDKMNPAIHQYLSKATMRRLINAPLMDNTLDSAYNLLNKAGFATKRVSNHMKSVSLSIGAIEGSIQGLLDHFDNNFSILDYSLSRSAFTVVMSKVWKEVLVTLEDLIIPPLLGLTTKQKPLSERELDILFKWLKLLRETFECDGGGIPSEELQTPKYHELLSIRFFYFDETETLICECNRMAAVGLKKENTHNALVGHQIVRTAVNYRNLVQKSKSHG